MASTSKTPTQTDPLSEHHQNEPQNVRLCQGCELPVDKTDVPSGKSATALVAALSFIEADPRAYQAI